MKMLFLQEKNLCGFTEESIHIFLLTFFLLSSPIGSNSEICSSFSAQRKKQFSKQTSRFPTRSDPGVSFVVSNHNNDFNMDIWILKYYFLFCCVYLTPVKHQLLHLQDMYPCLWNIHQAHTENN